MVYLTTLSLVQFIFINPEINMSSAQLQEALMTLSPPSIFVPSHFILSLIQLRPFICAPSTILGITYCETIFIIVFVE